MVKKKLKTFYYFSRLFPGLENCWANLKNLFKNSRLCTNPDLPQGTYDKCSSVSKRLGARLGIREEASSSTPALTASSICFSLVPCSNLLFQSTTTLLETANSPVVSPYYVSFNFLLGHSSLSTKKCSLAAEWIFGSYLFGWTTPKIVRGQRL